MSAGAVLDRPPPAAPPAPRRDRQRPREPEERRTWHHGQRWGPLKWCRCNSPGRRDLDGCPECEVDGYDPVDWS